MSAENATALGNSRFRSAVGFGRGENSVRSRRGDAAAAERDDEGRELLPGVHSGRIIQSGPLMASKRAAGLLIGLVSAVLVLGGDRLLSAVSRGGLNPFELAELRTYDWRLTHTARPEAARQDIVIVEIDEKSLRMLQPNAGRWPWPRVVHAMLVDYLSRAPAKVIAYDIVFSEADTRRGFDFSDTVMSGAESDKALADSVKAAGNVILVADASADMEVEHLTLPDSGVPLDVPGCLRAARRAAASPDAGRRRRGSRAQPLRPRPRRSTAARDPVRAHAPSRRAVARHECRAAGRRDSPAGHVARRDAAARRRSRDAAVVAPRQSGGRRSSASSGIRSTFAARRCSRI